MLQIELTSASPNLPSTLSRRSLFQHTSVLAAAASFIWLVPEQVSAATQGTGATLTLEHFYLNIATYAYEDAYALLAPKLQKAQSLDDFIDGYADTAYVQLEISGQSPSDDGTTIDVTITSWHNDRSIQGYSGTYTLKQLDGDWRIVAASIQQLDAPDVAPLMQFEDLDISLGQATAGLGHRYFEILFANISESVVTAAGVPQLSLLDGSNQIILESSSAETQPITAVELQPGESASVQFEWSNWCDEPPEFPLKLKIAIPADPDRETIAFTEKMGIEQTPPCMGSAEPGIFTCKAFTLATNR